MRLFRPRTALFPAAAIVCLSWPASPATADMPNEVEPEYAQSVLDYNAHQYDRALTMLSGIQKKAPKSPEILELKAITYKAMNKPEDAANMYRSLVQLKTREGKEKREIAPYAFELGVIRYNQKNWTQAEQYLQFAARNGFNVELAKFYLGMLQVQTQAWSKAERNFVDVIAGPIDELKPPAHYYLAQVYFKLGTPSAGFGNLIDAKRTAQAYIDRPDVQPESKQMAEQVRSAADMTLKPFDKASSFGNFSLLFGYDSNVLLVPSDTSVTTGASGKSTMKSQVSAGYGYATSPLAALQWVPSVRFNFNKNLNSASSTGEFADTTFALYATRDALAAFSYGGKVEATAVFQNQTDTNGSKKYHMYDTMITAAPYLKWDAARKWTIGAEAGVRMTGYSGDDIVSDSLKRSGSTLYARLTVQNKAARRYFNPTYVLTAERASTDGTEYDSMLLGAQILNTMTLGRVDFTQVLSYTKTNYAQSSTQRSDSLYSLTLMTTKKIGPRWALIASGDYTKNSSTDSTVYSYDRYTLNAGVGYSF